MSTFVLETTSTHALLLLLPTILTCGECSDAGCLLYYTKNGHASDTHVSCSVRELRGVPDDLRTVLETALAEEASPESLERYLPQVRQIITDLLQGLRNKQSLFRQNAPDRDRRRAERQNSTSGSSTASGGGLRASARSSSKPRPLPPPRIDEEGQQQQQPFAAPPPPPPLPSQPLPAPPSATSPSATSPQKTAVASAVPDRISGVGRRKYSYGRSGSPLATSDGEGGPSRPSTDRFVGGFASRVTSQGEDGLADLAANAIAAEERLRSPPRGPRKLPGPPSLGSPPLSSSTEKDDPFGRRVSTGSTRSNATITQPSEPAAPSSPPKSAQPSVPADVKRYSLSDRPVSPPVRTPTVAVVAASPSPPTTSTATFQAMGEQSNGAASPASIPDSPLDPNQSPAVEQSLAALQQSDALARKASKRFSSYTFTKMAGGGGGGALGGTIKSMGSSKNLNRRSIAPSASIGQLTSKDLEALAEVDEPASPRHSTKLKSPIEEAQRNLSRSPSRSDIPPVPSVPPESRSPAVSRSPSLVNGKLPDTSSSATPQPNGHVETPAASKESAPPAPPSEPETFTLFLQVGRHVKKVTLDPETTLSYASLRVLFVDRFAYNPGQDNFPAIYIRDGNSGVQYELEDIDEIKNGALLSLNIERTSPQFR